MFDIIHQNTEDPRAGHYNCKLDDVQQIFNKTIQLWVKEFDEKLRKELFYDNKVDREEASARF